MLSTARKEGGIYVGRKGERESEGMEDEGREGQNKAEEGTEGGRTLTRQISSEFVHMPASGGQKPQFWANVDIWGSCTNPLLPMRAKFGVLE